MTEDTEGDVDLVDDEFERLGRLAGADLRQPAPADGFGTILRSAHRRRAKIAAVAAGVTVALVVAGLVVANSRTQDVPAPIATVPPVPVVPTTTPSDLESVAPPDAARLTSPGTWRTVEDPSSLAPDFPAAAVWTGTDVIVVGSNWADDTALSPPSAVAYDVGQDRWRRLADPPRALGQASLNVVPPAMQWTGSEALAVTSQGEVYSYDPVQDRWESRATADESMSLPAEDALVAISARGVLARSSTGWWWYDDTTDRWESVPAPSDGGQRSTLTALDQDRIVAASIDGATITSSVFDIASRTWRNGPPVEDAVVSKGKDHPITCDANDGLLVCFAEGFGTLDGVVIDPLIGLLNRFTLGNHSNLFTVRGLPWMTHASKLLSPRTATWEDLPARPYSSSVGRINAGVWTGSEIVFVGGRDSVSVGGPLGWTTAYTPLRLPGR